VALAAVLIGHFLLGFVWLVVLVAAVFFTSSETGGVDLVLLLGALSWLALVTATLLGLRHERRRHRTDAAHEQLSH